MNKFIGVVFSLILFVIPSVTLGASSLQSNLENAYVAPLLTKEGIYAFIYTPKDWDDNVLGDGSGSFSVEKNFQGEDIGGSIDITMPETNDGIYANKKVTWIAQNYFKEYISKSYEVKNVKKSKVTIAGVSGYLTEYTFDKSTYISISFAKDGKLYLVNAQAPIKVWKANKVAIKQSLATIQVGEFIIKK